MGHRGEKLAVSGRLFEFGFVSQHLVPIGRARKGDADQIIADRVGEEVSEFGGVGGVRSRVGDVEQRFGRALVHVQGRASGRGESHRAQGLDVLAGDDAGRMIEAACRVATAGQDRLLDFAHCERGQIRRHAHGMAENRLLHLEFRNAGESAAFAQPCDQPGRVGLDHIADRIDLTHQHVRGDLGDEVAKLRVRAPVRAPLASPRDQLFEIGPRRVALAVNGSPQGENFPGVPFGPTSTLRPPQSQTTAPRNKMPEIL